MARRSAERHLVIVAITVSVALAALTVWAVAEQGNALWQRDLADLRHAAAQAGADKTVALRGDLEKAFAAAGLAWQLGKTDGLGWWLEGRELWSLALLKTEDTGWQFVPRARDREAPPALIEALRATAGDPEAPTDEIHFAMAVGEAGEPQVVAARNLSPTARLALVASTAELLAHYWPPDDRAPWQVAPAATTGESLCELGIPFGEARLVPSAATARGLASHRQRRIAFVAATALGTAGAWGVVIWLMLRAVARQRELVRLQRRFVADVSHELKTPLTMIRLLAETLLDGRVRDLDRVRTYHQTITRESERLSVLLDGILDFSRLESERSPTELVECDVAQVARRAWILFEPQFAAENFSRQLEIAPDLPPVRADADALQQVFVNLLQNAYRYAGDGRYVRMNVGREGYLVVITVEDHGIGMTRGQLERLGDSFFRAEDTRVRQQRGTGLGLAIVNHIVRAHGGKLEVHSRPNEGSRFTVWLPCEPAGDESRRR
ncbi:MAG: HAMP domain-containing sensor histidine kinase [Phycisphaerae bacterium]